MNMVWRRGHMCGSAACEREAASAAASLQMRAFRTWKGVGVGNHGQGCAAIHPARAVGTRALAEAAGCWINSERFCLTEIRSMRIAEAPDNDSFTWWKRHPR